MLKTSKWRLESYIFTFVAPSLLPTETTDKYIQDWGKIIPCTKEEFLCQDSILMHYSVSVYKSSSTHFPILSL
jgi:hypothetical protein